MHAFCPLEVYGCGFQIFCFFMCHVNLGMLGLQTCILIWKIKTVLSRSQVIHMNETSQLSLWAWLPRMHIKVLERAETPDKGPSLGAICTQIPPSPVSCLLVDKDWKAALLGSWWESASWVAVADEVEERKAQGCHLSWDSGNASGSCCIFSWPPDNPTLLSLPPGDPVLWLRQHQFLLCPRNAGLTVASLCFLWPLGSSFARVSSVVCALISWWNPESHTESGYSTQKQSPLFVY